MKILLYKLKNKVAKQQKKKKKKIGSMQIIWKNDEIFFSLSNTDFLFYFRFPFSLFLLLFFCNLLQKAPLSKVSSQFKLDYSLLFSWKFHLYSISCFNKKTHTHKFPFGFSSVVVAAEISKKKIFFYSILNN